MKEFMLEIDCWMYDGLEEYLLSLPGVLEVSISDSINFFVYIKYDSIVTNYKILKLEICFWLGILKYPSIVSFNKYSKFKTTQYDIIIKDLCCEICFRGMIEELFEIEGIEKAVSNFDENKNFKENVIITIDYNPELIKEAEIKKLELQFNEQ